MSTASLGRRGGSANSQVVLAPRATKSTASTVEGMSNGAGTQDDLIIKAATIEEARKAEELIPEFGGASDITEYFSRIGEAKHLVLVARVDGEAVGFKVGYEIAPGVFYSWIGGVVPKARRAHVAEKLMQEQEKWGKAHGYKKIQVKSKNRFGSMMIMLIKAGYQIYGVEEGMGEPKILFEKQLST